MIKGRPGIQRAGILFLLLTVAFLSGAEENCEHYIVEGWYNPTGLEELVETFKVLRYEWKTEKKEMEVEIQWEGVEIVTGRETGKSVITIDSLDEEPRRMVVWLDQAGEPVQVEVNGEIIPKMLDEIMFKSIEQLVFLPFQMADFYLGEQIITGHTADGWTVCTAGTGRWELGEKTIDTLSMEGLLGPPVTSGEYEVQWVMGDFGHMWMLLTWQVAEIGSCEYVYYELKEAVLKNETDSPAGAD